MSAVYIEADSRLITVDADSARWLAAELSTAINGTLPGCAAAALEIESALDKSRGQPVRLAQVEREAILRVLETAAGSHWISPPLARLRVAFLEEQLQALG